MVDSLVLENQEFSMLFSSISGLIYSFDDNISSKYSELLVSLGEYLKSEDEKQKGITKDSIGMGYTIQKIGDLQRLLREKKISIRN